MADMKVLRSSLASMCNDLIASARCSVRIDYGASATTARIFCIWHDFRHCRGGPQPHPASAGVGKPAMHEVAEGRVPGRNRLYGDLMPGAGPADRASSGQ
jgi:hypothetical protein